MYTAADLMTENPRVVTTTDSWLAVLDVMLELGVRHVPVVDTDGNLVGLVSQRDLLRAGGAVPHITTALRRELYSMRNVEGLMVTGIETVEPETPVRDVGEMMLENKFGCVPVCEGERLVGIVTEADFVRHVVDELAED